MIKLSPPCSYQGGKQRLAKKIIDIIFEQNIVNDDTKFYDLCCGSGAITLELINRGVHPNNITMVDNGVYGSFWASIANNEFELDKFKDMVNAIPDKPYIKKHLEGLSQVVLENYEYQYLLLQAGSFGGKEISLKDSKWEHHGFRNYWMPTPTSVRRSPCNPMQPNPQEIYNRVENIHNHMAGSIRVMNCKVEDFIESEIFGENTIIYIDPPYIGTTGYSNALDVMSVVNKIPKHIPIYLSECNILSNNVKFITGGKSKGNITGNVKTNRKDDLLNIFNK